MTPVEKASSMVQSKTNEKSMYIVHIHIAKQWAKILSFQITAEEAASKKATLCLFLSLFYLCFSRVLENPSSCASFEFLASPTVSSSKSTSLSLRFIYSI